MFWLSKKFFFFTGLAVVFNAEAIVFDGALENYPNNLRTYYYKEIYPLSSNDLANLNLQTINKIQNIKPTQVSRRASQVPLQQVDQLHKVINQNPVTNPNVTYKYNPPRIDIGFCFGRATFAHLMLLKMGLQKESIMKIWAVGPIKTPTVTWEFHVATIAYTQELGWMVIDNFFDRPLSVRRWTELISLMNTNSRMRIYITPAEKFSILTGKYDRTDLGLDLALNRDWYRHYFIDMMKSFRESNLENLGLVNLNK